MKKRNLLWLLLLTINQAFSIGISDQKTDSLLRKAKTQFAQTPGKGIALANQALILSKTNKDRIGEVKSLNLIAQFYLRSRKYDSAKVEGNYALQMAGKYGLDSLKGDSWLILGILDHTQSNYRQAIDKYSKVVFFSRKKLTVAVAYLNIGICAQQISDYNEGIRNCLKAISIFESLKDDINLSNAYKSIALCFVSLNDYPKAIEYNKKALAIRVRQKDDYLIAQSLNNIGFAYKEYDKPDSAILYLTKSILLYSKEPDSSLKILPLQNLGAAWKKKGDLKKAETYISRSIKIASIYKMDEELARGSLDIADVYISQKKYSNALAAANITESIAKRLKLPELLLQVYTNKVSLYTKKGEFREAIFFENKKDSLKTVLFNIDKGLAINKLEIQFQSKQREAQIKALNLQSNLQKQIVSQQSLSIRILIIAAVLLLVLFVIAFRNFLLKTKANARIQMLMREIHHRVSNNLMIVSSLFTMQIEMSDDTTKNTLRENESRILAMNLIHNKLYLNHDTTQIEMEEYLTKLLHHIKSAFGGDDVYMRLEIDNMMIEADKAVSIGLLITELATNSFKYAFTNIKNKRGEIYLHFKKEGKKMLLKFGDNGPGIPENKGKKQGFGLKLAGMLSQQLGSKLEMDTGGKLCYRMEINI